MIIGRMIQPLDLKRKTYNRSECAWFFSSTDQNWLLSNFAGGMPFQFAGKRWNSSEHLYQFSKYTPGTICVPASSKGKPNVNPDVRERILTSNNARAAKMTQKCAEKAGLVRAGWSVPGEEVRVKIMNSVLELKLFYHEVFRDALLATGVKPIVEISRRDDFWGAIPDCDKLIGRNVLGKLLTDLRSRADQVRDGRISNTKGLLTPNIIGEEYGNHMRY